MTTNCIYHCSSCGRHFHSLTAFDAHRTGDFAKPTGSEEGRRCLSPVEIFNEKGEQRLDSKEGICRMEGENANGNPRAEDPAIIWAMRMTPELRERLSRAFGSVPEGTEGDDRP